MSKAIALSASSTLPEVSNKFGEFIFISETAGEVGRFKKQKPIGKTKRGWDFLVVDQSNEKQMLLRQLDAKTDSVDTILKPYELVQTVDSQYVDKVVHLFRNDQRVFVIMPFSDRENLQYFHKRMYLSFTEKIIVHIGEQISKALQALHAKNACFSTLGLENISKVGRGNNDNEWDIIFDDFDALEAGQDVDRDITNFGFILYELLTFNTSTKKTWTVEKEKTRGDMRKNMEKPMIGATSNDLIDLVLEMVFAEKKPTLSNVQEFLKNKHAQL
jgi:serine/threonine protein kinase